MNFLLDVVIGITFLYLLLALVVTTSQELLASLLEFRAKDLYDTLAGMLAPSPGGATDAKKGPDTLLNEVYAHPLIKNLRRAAKNDLRLPSYIPSKTYAIVLLDVLRRRSTLSGELGTAKLLASARETVSKIAGHEDMKRVLELIFEEAESAATRVDEEVEHVVAGIESWFNDRMSRASGWYKRKSQLFALALAACVTLGGNADSIHVVSELWRNGVLREQIADGAAAFDARKQARSDGETRSTTPLAATPDGNQSTTGQAVQAVVSAVSDLKSAELPIGWKKGAWPIDVRGWLLRVLGWIMTTLAVSLGAGFWFDALGEALGLRKTGPKVSAVTGRTEGNA